MTSYGAARLVRVIRDFGISAAEATSAMRSIADAAREWERRDGHCVECELLICQHTDTPRACWLGARP